MQHNAPLLFADQLSALLKDSHTASSHVCSHTKTANNAPYFKDGIVQLMSKRTATHIPSRAQMTQAGCRSYSLYSLGRDNLFFSKPLYFLKKKFLSTWIAEKYPIQKLFEDSHIRKPVQLTYVINSYIKHIRNNIKSCMLCTRERELGGKLNMSKKKKKEKWRTDYEVNYCLRFHLNTACSPGSYTTTKKNNSSTHGGNK